MEILVKQIELAKKSMQEAEKLIKKYMPFIKSEASKIMKKQAVESDDEVSIAMIAFHEAIKSYDKEKGSFMSYSAILIRNRIIDFYRKESKHLNNDNLQEVDHEGISLEDKLADEKDEYENLDNLKATKDEIIELSKVLNSFGVSLTDIAENSPKQERTLSHCREIVRYLMENRKYLDEIEKTGKLPVTHLSNVVGINKKVIERHRKYILAMAIIQTNGYEIIRGHIYQVLNLKGGSV